MDPPQLSLFGGPDPPEMSFFDSPDRRDYGGDVEGSPIPRSNNRDLLGFGQLLCPSLDKGGGGCSCTGIHRLLGALGDANSTRLGYCCVGHGFGCFPKRFHWVQCPIPTILTSLAILKGLRVGSEPPLDNRVCAVLLTPTDHAQRSVMFHRVITRWPLDSKKRHWTRGGSLRKTVIVEGEEGGVPPLLSTVYQAPSWLYPQRKGSRQSVGVRIPNSRGHAKA